MFPAQRIGAMPHLVSPTSGRLSPGAFCTPAGTADPAIGRRGAGAGRGSKGMGCSGASGPSSVFARGGEPSPALAVPCPPATGDPAAAVALSGAARGKPRFCDKIRRSLGSGRAAGTARFRGGVLPELSGVRSRENRSGNGSPDLTAAVMSAPRGTTRAASWRPLPEPLWDHATLEQNAPPTKLNSRRSDRTRSQPRFDFLTVPNRHRA